MFLFYGGFYVFFILICLIIFESMIRIMDGYI